MEEKNLSETPKEQQSVLQENEKKKKKSDKKKLSKGKKILLIVAVCLVSLILLATLTFFVLKFFGYRQFHKDDTHLMHNKVKIKDENVITYKGEDYELNQNIVSILILGIDRRNISEDKGIGQNGQADCIFLACIDTEKKNYTIIPISREAMVDVDTYTADGMFSGTKKEQICMAYAYGSTPKECSENVLKSARRMFFGINISSYVTIDIDGFSKLSTMVGGIELTALETVSSNKVYFTEGEKLNLTGDKALQYIRARGKDIDANNRRMKRQKQFLTALISKTGNNVLGDFTLVSSYYNALQPYTSSNIDLAGVTYLASSCLSADMGSKIVYKSIEGTMTESKYSEFNINEEQLLDLAVETFYKKIK